MSKYILVIGDIVDFTDPETKEVYRGRIDEIRAGRDKKNNRDYLVRFNEPLWGIHDLAWCSKDNLELVKANSKGYTFITTSSASTISYPPIYDNSNLTIKMTDTLQKSSMSSGGMAGDNGAGSSRHQNYPWTKYYVKSDDFFDILKVAFDDTYGSEHEWHPEDLYINVSCVLEVVSNTLSNMVRINAGKPLHGVKDPS